MGKQVIDIGSSPNDNTGDQIRDSFDKTNNNFGELYDSLPEPIVFVCSAFETDLAADTGVAYLQFVKKFTLTQLPIATVKVAGTGSTITVDINNDGTTIFDTILSIDASELTSETAATPAVLTDDPTIFSPGDVLTVDIDQPGSSVAGQELLVTLWGLWEELVTTTTTTTTT